jgi:16S rRNA (guanine966-N2)-methyltransferase
MRVIAGTYRSRRLQALRGLAMRPSSDRLRETLFNILGAAVEGGIFVDLFAGSGAVGIEALSRGARQVVFVEKHPAAAALLRGNLDSLGIPVSGRPVGSEGVFPGSAEILPLDAGAALERLELRGLRADLVFADPPYADTEAYNCVLGLLGESELLAQGGCAVLEHDRRRVLPAVTGQLERARVVQQGDTSLSFYRLARAA